jgi:hypothetical protein
VEKHTVELLDEVALELCVLEAFLAGDEGGPQHQHDAVEETVHVLEAAGLAVPGCGEVALVPALALEALVLEADVGNLEDLHGDCVALVLAESLEETGDERCADNLVLEGFGVLEAHGPAVVLLVQPCVVLVV